MNQLFINSIEYNIVSFNKNKKILCYIVFLFFNYKSYRFIF